MSITAIQILVGNQDTPAGFTKIPVDLNAGTSGNPVFLAYQQADTADPQTCITGLDVIEGEGATPPEGWVKDPTDLNKGAGGKWLYLIYKKGGNEPPVTDIQIKIVASEQKVFVPSGYRYIPRDLNQGSGGNWIFLIYRQEFQLDEKSLIELTPKNRQYPFTVTLSGSALKGGDYEVLFDTGSWTLSLPYGCLDKDKLEVVQADTTDSWGKKADKVKGQISLKSSDGNTTYTVDDYIFYARKQDNGTDAPCDRSEIWGNSILGGFPSIEPGSGLKSLPYALAETYSTKKKLNFGFGIVGKADKSYLILGDDQRLLTYPLRWRTDIDLWQDATKIKFCPEAVGGFTVRFKFTKLPEPDNEIKVSNLKATIDTGAPEMTLRLNANNPQNSPPFSTYFTDDGFWKPWNSNIYNRDAKTITGDCTVTVEFKDSSGEVYSYSFETDKTKNKVAVGTWDGEVPWKIHDPEMPRTRFNLGNTIYHHCPIFYYDIKNKRVGISFG